MVLRKLRLTYSFSLRVVRVWREILILVASGPVHDDLRYQLTIEKANNLKTFTLLFSFHTSYGNGKYLNQTAFFTKFAKFQVYIQVKGFHP